jgi:hypothetical protein
MLQYVHTFINRTTGKTKRVEMGRNVGFAERFCSMNNFRGGNYLSSIVVINHQVEKRMFRKIHVEQRTDLGWCPGMTGGTLSGWEVPTVFAREEEGECSGRRSTCIQTNQSGHSPGVSCR